MSKGFLAPFDALEGVSGSGFVERQGTPFFHEIHQQDDNHNAPSTPEFGRLLNCCLVAGLP